eukprot:scaffold7074_cov256-Pinguiococcus_pyrenoidosus.AAC.9
MPPPEALAEVNDEEEEKPAPTFDQTVAIYFPDEGAAALARQEWKLVKSKKKKKPADDDEQEEEEDTTPLVPQNVRVKGLPRVVGEELVGPPPIKSSDAALVLLCPRAEDLSAIEKIYQAAQGAATPVVMINPNLIDMGTTAGAWVLKAGAWVLEAGAWVLEAGAWVLEAGAWRVRDDRRDVQAVRPDQHVSFIYKACRHRERHADHREVHGIDEPHAPGTDRRPCRAVVYFVHGRDPLGLARPDFVAERASIARAELFKGSAVVRHQLGKSMEGLSQGGVRLGSHVLGQRTHCRMQRLETVQICADLPQRGLQAMLGDELQPRAACQDLDGGIPQVLNDHANLKKSGSVCRLVHGTTAAVRFPFSPCRRQPLRQAAVLPMVKSSPSLDAIVQPMRKGEVVLLRVPPPRHPLHREPCLTNLVGPLPGGAAENPRRHPIYVEKPPLAHQSPPGHFCDGLAESGGHLEPQKILRSAEIQRQLEYVVIQPLQARRVAAVLHRRPAPAPLPGLPGYQMQPTTQKTSQHMTGERHRSAAETCGLTRQSGAAVPADGATPTSSTARCSCRSSSGRSIWRLMTRVLSLHGGDAKTPRGELERCTIVAVGSGNRG